MGIFYIATQVREANIPSIDVEVWYKTSNEIDEFRQIQLHGSPMILTNEDGQYLCFKMPDRNDGMLRNGDWPDDYIRHRTIKDMLEEVVASVPQA